MMLAMSQALSGREQPRLLNGRMMSCPRCKRSRDILQFVPMKMIEEFAHDTTPVYKCPECHWIFAPADSLLLHELMNRLGRNGEQPREAA